MRKEVVTIKITSVQSVFQLAFLPRLFPVNCYLVSEHDGFTLIDAGIPFSFKGIMSAASRLGKPIRRIVLTHAHEDHVGASARQRSSSIHTCRWSRSDIGETGCCDQPSDS